MTETAAGTVLITGPTGGLGREAALAMAQRPAGQRPDLILVGRVGPALTEVADAARARGATVVTVGGDLARLADVRAAARVVRDAVAVGSVRPLRAVVANAGITALDGRSTSEDGFEKTFAVNYLAHAQLIGDLVDTLDTPARIVLVGSNTYHQNVYRRILQVPPAAWGDPRTLAYPLIGGKAGITEGGSAYSNSKLALMYYAHELQRRVPDGVAVTVFEPGFMPGTGLSRAQPAAVQQIARLIGRLPGVSTPQKSGPALASFALDQRWAHLRDGAFVVKNREQQVKPFAVDVHREAELWDVTTDLLRGAAEADQDTLD